MSKAILIITFVVGVLIFLLVGFTVYAVNADPVVLAEQVENFFNSNSVTYLIDNLDYFIPVFVGLVIMLPVVPLVFGVRARVQKIKLLKERGQRAFAKVISVKDTGVTFNNNPSINMELELRPGLTTRMTTVVPRISVPRPGDQIEIIYDPANPEDVLLASTVK